jgi:hypothetical protein
MSLRVGQHVKIIGASFGVNLHSCDYGWIQKIRMPDQYLVTPNKNSMSYCWWYHAKDLRISDIFQNEEDVIDG